MHESVGGRRRRTDDGGSVEHRHSQRDANHTKRTHLRSYTRSSLNELSGFGGVTLPIREVSKLSISCVGATLTIDGTAVIALRQSDLGMARLLAP